ncbi:MAG: hypothetical protein ABSC45_02330 [Desulfobaccales bacterium]|jgi:hypothetical protein
MPDEHEVLHMSKRMRLDDEVYDREVSYLSDHQIMHRLAHNGNWSAWSYWRLWERLEDLHRLADRKRSSGWEITWHPAYISALQEFTVKVPFPPR